MILLPRLPPPDPGRYRTAERRWLVLELPPSPTTDYYVRPRAERAGVPVSYRSIYEPPRPGDLAPGTRVIVVRYLSRVWGRALERAAAGLAGLVYLMDDDLLDPAAWRGLPWGYQWRLWRHGRVLWPLLGRLASEYWMSTPALSQRYAHLSPRLTPPLPLREDLAPDVPQPPHPGGAGRVLLFYHGTRSHLAEMDWLRPIVGRVLADCPLLHFEAIGDVSVQRRFRDLPRARVLHPMPWPAYLAHCRWLAGQPAGQSIGLAPLLPSRFNAVRSHTRVLDIARCRAAGLYAQGMPYAGVIRHGRDGLLLPPDPQAWEQAIRQLCADAALRLALGRAGVERARELADAGPAAARPALRREGL